MSADTGRARLYFLDNVRWIMIARVAVFHVAVGYSALPEYYYETQAGGAIAIVLNIVQASSFARDSPTALIVCLFAWLLGSNSRARKLGTLAQTWASATVLRLFCGAKGR